MVHMHHLGCVSVQDEAAEAAHAPFIPDHIQVTSTSRVGGREGDAGQNECKYRTTLCLGFIVMIMCKILGMYIYMYLYKCTYLYAYLSSGKYGLSSAPLHEKLNKYSHDALLQAHPRSEYTQEIMVSCHPTPAPVIPITAGSVRRPWLPSVDAFVDIAL